MSKAQFLKENLKLGEVYAGLVLGQNGEADYHLILLVGETGGVTHQQAHAWAKEQGGELPNRRELRLLWVNAKDQFKADWYWSSEQPATGSDYAWVQNFYDGSQGYSRKDSTLRARAVRRLPL